MGCAMPGMKRRKPKGYADGGYVDPKKDKKPMRSKKSPMKSGRGR